VAESVPSVEDEESGRRAPRPPRPLPSCPVAAPRPKARLEAPLALLPVVLESSERGLSVRLEPVAPRFRRAAWLLPDGPMRRTFLPPAPRRPAPFRGVGTAPRERTLFSAPPRLVRVAADASSFHGARARRFALEPAALDLPAAPDLPATPATPDRSAPPSRRTGRFPTVPLLAPELLRGARNAPWDERAPGAGRERIVPAFRRVERRLPEFRLRVAAPPPERRGAAERVDGRERFLVERLGTARLERGEAEKPGCRNERLELGRAAPLLELGRRPLVAAGARRARDERAVALLRERLEEDPERSARPELEGARLERKLPEEERPDERTEEERPKEPPEERPEERPDERPKEPPEERPEERPKERPPPERPPPRLCASSVGNQEEPEELALLGPDATSRTRAATTVQPISVRRRHRRRRRTTRESGAESDTACSLPGSCLSVRSVMFVLPLTAARKNRAAQETRPPCQGRI